MRRDELGGMWAVAPSADPDLLGAPVPDDVRPRLLHQVSMHLDDGRAVQSVSQGDGGLHQPAVGHDFGRVVPRGVPQFRRSYGPRRCREVLDLAGGR